MFQLSPAEGGERRRLIRLLGKALPHKSGTLRSSDIKENGCCEITQVVDENTVNHLRFLLDRQVACRFSPAERREILKLTGFAEKNACSIKDHPLQDQEPIIHCRHKMG